MRVSPALPWIEVSPWRVPWLSWLLQSRAAAIWIVAAAAVHLVLSAFGFPALVCPFRTALGIRCPGCGLTGATLELLRGHWGEALALHPLAPVFLPLLAMAGWAAFAPRAWRDRTLDRLATLETKMVLAPALTVLLLVVWTSRIFSAP